MTSLDKTPRYNLNAVLRETGLKADLLRVWEKRYQLPKPQRTEGGHRVYSDYDIATILWLKSKIAEGLSIRHAVDLWNSILEKGDDPFTQSYQQATPFSPVVPTPELTLATLREDWLAACLRFDKQKADLILDQAFAIYSVETVVTQILRQSLHEIGSGWFENVITVQQEHFASILTSQRLQTLILLNPPPTRNQTILIGCPAGEQHTLSALFLHLLLVRHGFNVLNLSGDIPLDKLVPTALQVHPDLIILTAQTLPTAASLRDAFLLLQELEIPLSYGGGIFSLIPEVQQTIPAIYLGNDLDHAVQEVEKILASPYSPNRASTISKSLQEMANRFLEKRPEIDQIVNMLMKESGVPVEFLSEANSHFGKDIYAALKLGNPAFLNEDVHWIKHLLQHRGIAETLLANYLKAYQKGIIENIGQTATDLIHWFDQILQTLP